MSGESRGHKTKLSLPWGLSQRGVRESTVFMKALYNQTVLIRRVHRQGLCWDILTWSSGNLLWVSRDPTPRLEQPAHSPVPRGFLRVSGREVPAVSCPAPSTATCLLLPSPHKAAWSHSNQPWGANTLDLPSPQCAPLDMQSWQQRWGRCRGRSGIFSPAGLQSLPTGMHELSTTHRVVWLLDQHVLPNSISLSLLQIKEPVTRCTMTLD